MEKIFVDLECLMQSVGKITESFIEKYEYKASKNYLMTVDELYNSDSIDHEEYRVLLDEHYDVKDRLLEEIDNGYKGLIDYQEIYSLNNANMNMVEYISKMSKELDTYVIFYYNTERELNAKTKFCQQVLPNNKIISIKYHNLPYNKERKRKRTNKAKYVKKYLGLDSLEKCILIDKSIISCNDWNNENGETVAYRNDSLQNKLGNALKISKLY